MLRFVLCFKNIKPCFTSCRKARRMFKGLSARDKPLNKFLLLTQQIVHLGLECRKLRVAVVGVKHRVDEVVFQFLVDG